MKRMIVPLSIVISILGIILFAASMFKSFEKQEIYPAENTVRMNPDDRNDLEKAQKALDELYQYIDQEKQNFEVDTRTDGFNLIKIYNSDELDGVFGNRREDITYDDIIDDINANTGISLPYKKLYLTLVNNLRGQYPSLDLRIWHMNLQTLKIVELSEMDMQLKAMSGTASAVYRQDENVIYTVKEYEYIPGTWEYQVIMHEMGHPIRSLNTHLGETRVKARFQSYSGHGTVIGEALNSLLTLRSYDPYEKDIAYQFQSNMVELMVTEMDNYTYQDFVEHNLTYFEQKLNEYNGDEDAVEVIGLIELQYQDYHDKEYEIKESTFHKVYDYIAKMYYGNHLKSDMTEEERLKVRDEFIDKLTYDVPEEYQVNIPYLNEYFDHYCTELVPA